MDEIVERLSVDDVALPTLSASEHQHRYRWAGSMVDGLRVLDLACGVGYGSLILAESAASVHGVDYDEEAVKEARVSAAARATVSFEIADALAFLEQDLSGDFDAVVCFEGLEHFHDLDRVVERLRWHADKGLQV